jgi:periplasmic protein TonB
MFDSVLGRGVGAAGRPGVGAAISVGLHALVLALAVLISHPLSAPLPLPPIHFPVRLGQPSPAGPRATAPRAHPPAVKPRTTTQALPPAVPQTRDLPSSKDTDSASPSGRDGASGEGGENTCLFPPCTTGSTPGGGSAVLLLGPEMVRPRLLSGPEPRYTAEAALEHIGGTVLVQCTVTDLGTVEDCLVTKSLPFLDASVLRAVSARRYEPALFEGRPVSVRMVIPVRFVPP